MFQPVGSGCNYLRFRGSPVAQAQVCYLGPGEMARSSFPELVSQTVSVAFHTKNGRSISSHVVCAGEDTV